MSSNNPFAAALNEPDSYVHRRDPPPPPPPSNKRTNSHGKEVPSRPPKPENSLPPPAYDEVTNDRSNKNEYPREKQTSNSSSNDYVSRGSRPHRSHSDSSRPHRSSNGRSRDDSDRDRDRERRHRHHHHKSSRNKSPSKKKQPEPVKAKNLDTIDKLDVTAFFGGGFHHDGPFDACTPHRNKNQKQAPVMAFPVDGPNNSIKGLAPNIDKNEQMNLAFGYNDNEYLNNSNKDKNVTTTTTKPYQDSDENLPTPGLKTNKQSKDLTTTLYTPKLNPSVIGFDANKNAEPIHGSTTAGLGSSTFLDGAPAPKIGGGDEYLSVNGGGLGRKKSLVQRLRNNSHSENNTRRNSNENQYSNPSSPPVTSSRSSFGDDEVLGNSNSGNSLLRRVKSLKVGGRQR